MDCPSEENLIRVKLDGMEGMVHLDFDIPNRRLSIIHTGNSTAIEQSLDELDLGTKKIVTEQIEDAHFGKDNSERQRKVLVAVLIVNFAFFAIEMVTGLISRSMGLVADSLDMLADAFVYAISLFAVGKAVSTKKNVAKAAGYFQMALAVTGFAEVLRRFFSPEIVPDFRTMIVVSVLALVANGFCLYLLQRSNDKEAHMQASMIFTSNDIIINTGVIIGGILVFLLHSAIPDLVIGTIVFVLVVRGAVRILKLAKG